MTKKEVFVSKLEKGLNVLFNESGVDKMFLTDAMNQLKKKDETNLGVEIIKAYEEFRDVLYGVQLFWYSDRFKNNVKLVNEFEVVKEGKRWVIKRK